MYSVERFMRSLSKTRVALWKFTQSLTVKRSIYFVPISSIKGVKCDDGFGVCQQIVASPISSIQDKKTFLWITEEVTDRVNPNPVKENN